MLPGGTAGLHTLIDHAVAYGCSRVQFFKPYIRRDMIERAQALGAYDGNRRSRFIQAVPFAALICIFRLPAFMASIPMI